MNLKISIQRVISLCCIFILLGISVCASPQEDIISESFIKVSSLQRQLNNLAKSSFINLVEDRSNEAILKQAQVLKKQIEDLEREVVGVTGQDLTSSQLAQTKSLFTITSYLNYMQEQIGRASCRERVLRLV